MDDAERPEAGENADVINDTADAIADSVRALRLVKAEWVKTELSPPAPSTQAFQDRRESGAMSVYLEDELLAAGRSLEDLQKRWDGYWIFSLTVGQFRDDFGQDVLRDPQADFPGHGLVRDPAGKRSQGKKSRMAAACTLVRHPYEETAPEQDPANSEGANSLPDGTNDSAGSKWLRRTWHRLRELIRQ